LWANEVHMFNGYCEHMCCKSAGQQM
jgi:hypothetical protein